MPPESGRWAVASPASPAPEPPECGDAAAALRRNQKLRIFAFCDSDGAKVTFLQIAAAPKLINQKLLFSHLDVYK